MELLALTQLTHSYVLLSSVEARYCHIGTHIKAWTRLSISNIAFACLFFHHTYIHTYLEGRRKLQQGLKQQWRKLKSFARNKTTRTTLSWLVREGSSPFHVRMCSVISTMCLLQNPKGTRRVRELGKGQHARSRSHNRMALLCVGVVCMYTLCTLHYECMYVYVYNVCVYMYVCMYVCI